MTSHDMIPCDSKRGHVARLVSESKAFIRERVLHASSPQTPSVAAVGGTAAKKHSGTRQRVGGEG